jgi:hypothetical protein
MFSTISNVAKTVQNGEKEKIEKQQEKEIV